MMKLRKAVFPVAGMGTRFLPATKSIPKEMLPIVDRPIIQYAVDEAVEAGCDTLIFVTGRSKRAVEDYFDRNPELEAELEAKGKLAELEIVRNIVPSHVKVLFVRQASPLGLGHAVLCAAPMIGEDEHFAVLLPDDLIDGYPVGALKQMVDTASNTGGSVIAVEQVAREDVSKYGIVDMDPTDAHGGAVSKVRAIVEKPSIELAPSTNAVVGRYILHSSLFKSLESQAPGMGGEIQLTDALAKQIDSPGLYAYRFGGKRFDCGSKRGFLVANIHYGLR
jgi:UTP--glucose-1-phosphate uridylyltransferase